MNIGKIERDSCIYPKMLAGIKEPPVSINYIGKKELLATECVAIVGSRKCTSYGKAVARSLAGRLAECGVTVVSGMASGIDRAAHEGALEAGGSTIAVLGCGVDVCYPLGNRDIKKEIENRGLVISELDNGAEPIHWNFPRRNRLISGLSLAVVVVEAAFRSGSLITAEYALDQSRRLYAVPANINSKASFGSNDLLRGAAQPLVRYDDILTDLGIEPKDAVPRDEMLDKDEKSIYDMVKNGGEMTVDQISNRTLLDPAAVKGIITVLEMKGMVVSSMGRVFVNNISIDSNFQL